MDTPNQQNLWRAGFVLLLILSVFFIVRTINEIRLSGGYAPFTEAKNVIHVSGEGKVLAVPDIAAFSFSVQSESKVVADAQKAVADKTRKVAAFLRDSMKLDEKDIQTTNYTIYPRYVYPQYRTAGEADRTLAGYEVTQTISVKLRDVAKSGALLSGLGALGVNNISGPAFTVDKQEELRKDARAKAILEAKTNAEKLAKDLGVRLVRIVDFNEAGNQSGPILYEKSTAAYGMGGGTAMDALPAGQNEIISQVNITYEIR